MSFMTKTEGEFDRDSVRPGMAFFAGSGPFGETCGNCKHLDGASNTRKKGNARCAMFKKLAGRTGEVVDPRYSACKYFEARPKPKPIVAKQKRSTPIARTVAESNADNLRALNNMLPLHLKP
jgi:hypothetical protein